MASLLVEAVEVITDDGTGLPIIGPGIAAIGLASDGHFVWVTDRPTITTMSGATTRTTWYPRILTRDYGNWTLSRNIDFVEAGAMESVSDFQVGIVNIADFRNALQSNGIYLGRRRVKYYRFTSSNGTDWTSELRWTGVVDDQPFNERTYSLKCVSTAKDIFGSLPTVPVNSSTFTGAPQDSQDKMVPIALGRVAYSPLVNVSGSGEKTVLNMVSGINYPNGVIAGPNPVNVTGCYGYAPANSYKPADGGSALAVLEILTLGKFFAAGELQGKYVNVVAGGLSQSIRIVDNSATNQYVGVTNLYLAENLDLTNPFVSYEGGSDSQDMWYVEVADYASTLIASTKPIVSFNSGGSHPLAAYRYLSDAKLFDAVGEAVIRSSVSNIQSTGFPGFFACSDTADNGALVFYSAIRPSAIYVQDAVGFTGLPAVGMIAPTLNNGDPSDYYTLDLTWASTFGVGSFSLDLEFPSDAVLRQFDALYPLFDLSHKASGAAGALMYFWAFGIDYLGRATSPIVNKYNFKNSAIDIAFVDLLRLPGSYFNIVRDDAAFYKEKENFDVHSLIGDTKKSTAYNRVRVKIEVDTILSGGGTYTMRLREMGLVGKRSLSMSSESIYAGLIGETFGSTWDGRKTASDPILNVVDGLEHLIRNYDEPAAFWQASHPYAVGDKVRAVADTGHVFVCTVAGASSGSEPTWTDTTGATYTDGGVTWKEHHEIPIDTGSFDTTAYYRSGWNIGRTLTDKKPSADYYQDLLQKAFLLGVFAPDGKFQIKAWLNNRTPLAAFDETNILAGTLGDVTTTPVRRMYNELRLKYDKNPASGTYNKQIVVTNIDKPAFPGPMETTSDGVSLGAFTVTAEFNYDFTTPLFTFTFATVNPHGRTSGDYVSLSGNTEGYDFAPAGGFQMVVVDANTFKVSGLTNGITAPSSTSGTLYHNSSLRVKWKDYVAGIDNYSVAEGLWQQCHASYLVTMRVNPLPDEMGQCDWYFDAYAKDPNGKYIWSDDGGLTVTSSLDTGDSHAAAYLADAYANWTAWRKKQVTFEAADTSTFSALNLGDCVSFADQKLTGGSSLIGWIHEKTQLPRDERRPERFRFGITLYPEALNTYTTPGIIEEHGATDIIDEHGAINIIEEHGA